MGPAVVPVGGGRAWPDNEPTRRAKLVARTARGRAAAHGHTEQPGPQDSTYGARNTSGATQQPKPQKPNEKCPRKRQYSQLHSSTPKSHMGNMRAS